MRILMTAILKSCFIAEIPLFMLNFNNILIIFVRKMSLCVSVALNALLGYYKQLRCWQKKCVAPSRPFHQAQETLSHILKRELQRFSSIFVGEIELKILRRNDDFIIMAFSTNCRVHVSLL